MNILDPKFLYVNSEETDLRKTFARIRRREKEGANTIAADAKVMPNVISLPSKRKTAA